MTAGAESGEAKNILVGLDETANALLGGDPRWTLSARMWAARNDKTAFGAFARMMIPVLGAIQKNHCELSYERMIALDARDATQAQVLTSNAD
jgi:hypothetical protein